MVPSLKALPRTIPKARSLTEKERNETEEPSECRRQPVAVREVREAEAQMSESTLGTEACSALAQVGRDCSV